MQLQHTVRVTSHQCMVRTVLLQELQHVSAMVKTHMLLLIQYKRTVGLPEVKEGGEKLENDLNMIVTNCNIVLWIHHIKKKKVNLLPLSKTLGVWPTPPTLPYPCLYPYKTPTLEKG